MKTPVWCRWGRSAIRLASAPPSRRLRQSDGNHASKTGALLMALVLYPIITAQLVESLPELSAFDIDAATEQVMREAVSSLLYTDETREFEG